MIYLTPIKAIRRKCLECSSGSPSVVKNCDDHDCSLFIYRFGKNPNRKGIGGAGFKNNNKTDGESLSDL